MTELVIESIPSGAEVRIDGEIVGVTPTTIDVIEKQVDMVIFVSPQYKDDSAISMAMNTYIDAVKNDIGWNVVIEHVGQSDNQYDTIQGKIDEIYNNNPLKACMMVGEDMAIEKNVFHTSGSRHCEQALPFWQSYGAPFSMSCDSKIVVDRNLIRVAVSLMYPNHNDSYNQKKNQIIYALNKFSTNRKKTYTDGTISFYDSFFSRFGNILVNEVGTIGNATVIDDPTQSEVDSILSSQYKFVFAGGHAGPGSVAVNPDVATFRAYKHARVVKTPFLMVYGCGTKGWRTDINDDCLYQSPSNWGDWFGHKIFENDSIRVIVGGFPVGRYADDVFPAVGFICSECLGKMAAGKTIAEAMQGIWIYGSDTTLFGDPTFHY